MQLTSVILCSVLDFLTLEDRTNKLSLNICKELPLFAALCPRRVQTSYDDLVM